MRSELFDAQNMAQAPSGVGISLQHSRCVKAVVNGEMLARQGAMVAYRGKLGMQVKSQGIGNFLKRAVTGEGLSLMSVRGQGEMWFASLGHKCFLVDIEPGDGLSINGRNVLCFEAALQYEIRMVQGAGMFAGGLFNSLFTGSGRLALTCDGDPIVLPVTPDAPVFVDTDALVGWSAQLQTTIQRSEGMKSILKGGSGEMFQVVFHGQGFVIIQPSEGPFIPASNSGGGGGLLGNLMNG